MYLEVLFAVSLGLFYLEYSTLLLKHSENSIGGTDVSLQPFIRILIKIYQTS